MRWILVNVALRSDTFLLTLSVLLILAVQLIGGSNSHEGRVEVYINDEWGTVCDDTWDMDDARVICRQLGFGPPTLAPGSAYFGQGSGSILLDDVQCDGSEPSLTFCTHSGVGVHNCAHSEDAGAVCSIRYIQTSKSRQNRRTYSFLTGAKPGKQSFY